MPLKRSFQLNLAWSCLMAAAFLLLFAGAPSLPQTILLLASFAFVGVSVAALRMRLWAVLAVVLTGVALLIRWLPMVLINGWMFLTDHPMYVDSPGTILVVAAYAIVFAVPALVVVASYAYQWRNLLSLFRPLAAEAPSVTIVVRF